ncbi:unnamed protein product [Allacma fusca]|uniref:N-acetyltransferase domain-containing protein n=1 Tax=Allacma fusca TaxID=39272 RepID=A0A8J2PB73_9HEXA|nr:unnamed protein product [Allacma fusca]
MKFDLNAPNPTAPFRRIPSGKILEKIILKRLPESGSIYNMMLMSANKPELGIQWYTLHGFISPESWIVATCLREDMGNEYSISSPPDAEITEEIKEAFKNSQLFDWNNKYLLAGIDNRLSKLFYEITIQEQGNSTLVLPCVALTISPEVAEEFCNEPNSFGPEVSVQPLNDDPSAVKFLAAGWSATKSGTEEHLTKLLDHLPSSGIYVDTELVSGILLKGHGTIGMSFTLPNHRAKGYARAAYKALIVELIKKQLVPCLHITISNETSRRFHEKIGFKITHRVDFFEFNGKQ